MKFLYKILFAAILLNFTYSCSDLEEDTSSLLNVGNIANESDVATNLAPIYRKLFDMHFQPHLTRIATYGGDDLTTWIGGNKAPLRVFDRFDYGSGENSDLEWLEHAWSHYWKIIYYSNTLIEALKTSSASQDLIDLADAEARAFRALSYLNLVKIHGNMPLILDGVLPTGEEQRATVLENYQQIESDLLIAESSLPTPGNELEGRATSAFAKAILADLYLTWAGWPIKDASKYALAASKAKEIIDYGYFELLPLDELWTIEGAMSKETIFSLRFPEDKSLLSTNATAWNFHQARGFSDAFPELQFFYDFPEGPRKDYTFLLDIPRRGVKDGAIIALDPPTTPWPNSDRAHPMYRKYLIAEDLTINDRPRSFRPADIYRYAEILLIYAEAQARIGENVSSIEALNQVKRRAAGLPYATPSASIDVASATAIEIVDEKGWELAAENKRWFDLVRTERVAEMAAKRDPLEPVDLRRLPTEDQYIAPLPFIAISLSKLVQNPDGFKVQ